MSVNITARFWYFFTKSVLKVMNEEGYVGTFEEIVEENGHKTLVLNLIGNINKCGVIKPRFSVKVSDIQKFEERYLIAKDMGIIIISTSQGLMTHIKAKERNLGGKLIAYCY